MANMKGINLWATVFLLLDGLILLIPQVNSWLTSVTGSVPWVQILVGAVSVILALVLFFGKKK